MQNQTNVDGASIQSIVTRPILFSSSMVRAILAGQKTQTRRVMKPQPTAFWNDGRQPVNLPYDRDNDKVIRCPYGKPGDRLWVRETCWSDGCDVYYTADAAHKTFGASDEYFERLLKLHHYAGSFSQKVPSIHMPRWASRITLEIDSVRVERLNDISNEDCTAEGITAIGKGVRMADGTYAQAGRYETKSSTVRQLYSELWDSINGPGSWNADPFVWVVGFKVV